MFLATLQQKNQRHQQQPQQRELEETAKHDDEESNNEETEVHSEASDTLHELPASYLRLTNSSSTEVVEPNPLLLVQTANKRTSRSLSALDETEDNDNALFHTSSLGGVLSRHHRKSTITTEMTMMRERSPSQTSVDSMYGRTGKVTPRFEVANPLLEPVAAADRQQRTMSMSEKELDTERIKMDMLLHSAPRRLDPAIFIEQRRGTITRRSSVQSCYEE